MDILQDVIKKEQPDVVHAHARIPGFLCGRLQRSMGFPFVTSCHGVYQVSGALRLLSNWGDRTLAVSEDIRDYLIHQYNIPPQHITLTINGKQVFQGMAKPNLQAMVNSCAEYFDPCRIFPVAIDAIY